MEGRALQSLRRASIGRVVWTARTEVLAVLILMALTPFMAAAMNGAVVIIGQLLLQLLRMLLVVIGGMFLKTFSIALVVSTKRYFV